MYTTRAVDPDPDPDWIRDPDSIGFVDPDSEFGSGSRIDQQSEEKVKTLHVLKRWMFSLEG